MTLQIDIISDVMCPWCVIGYSALQQALESFPQTPHQIRWHPFELNPDMPPEGQNLRQHLAEKYGSTDEQSRENRERITQMGAELGFTFNFSDDMRMVNSFNAHQLLSWAAELEGQPGYANSLQTDLQLALFNGHFRDGRDVSQTEVLVAIAAEAGLSAERAAEVLQQQQYASAVRAEQQQWQQMGIQSVPAVILQNKYLISGGQPVQVFVQAIQQCLDEQAASAG